jgi:DNA repair exonuclease SbcCD ATPase subunit/3',5'-cyclic AMP phosphodiesterase CpdA
MNKLKRIYHIADIHIRNLKRHTEYREVFDRLFNDIKLRGTDDSLIYLAGDLAHAKLEMSPELLSEINYFLKKCCELAPTILIAGNHDCNLNNQGRLDVLSPIVEALNLPNLTYLRDTQTYTYGGVRFDTFSIFDDKENWKFEPITSDTKNIALFHGPILDATTDVGFHISSRHFTTEMFDGYDLALLGDIHKRQEMISPKGCKVVYPGSLIQQNHGEALTKHGYAIWDIDTLSVEYVDVPNDYGYYTLHVENGEVPDVTDMPKKPRLRVLVSKTDASDMKRVTTEIKKKYKVDEFTITRTDTLSRLRTGNRDGKLNVGNVNDAQYQAGLIKDYLGRNYMLDDETLGKIEDLNNKLNKRLTDDDLVRNILWKPIKFEFSNMFSYGENNIVNFDNMKGLLGVFAPNASGKSSLFDALSFCIFDKSSRAFKAQNVLNNRKSEFFCKLEFEINEEKFFIERTAKTNKKGDSVKVDVNFWRLDGDDVVSLNGTERRDTDKAIESYLGKYEDFVLTALSLQGNNSLFIDKSQSERKDLLAQFMGINVFDKLYDLASEDIKEVQVLLRNFKRTDFTSELATAETKLDELIDNYEGLEIEKEGYEDRQEELNEKITELSAQLVPMDGNLDITELTTRKSQLQTSLSDLEVTMGTKANNISIYIEKLVELKELIDTKANPNGVDIEVVYSNYKAEQTKLIEATKVYDNAKLHLSLAEEKIKHLDKHEYDPNCKFCCNNTFVKDATNAKNALPQLEEIVRQALIDCTGIQQTIDVMEGVEEQYNEVTELKAKYEKGKGLHKNATLEFSGLITQKELYEAQLTAVDLDIERYHANEANIQNNNKLNDEIEDIRIELGKVTKDLREINSSLLTLNGDVVKTNSYIQSITDKMQEAKVLEEQFQIYEYYLDAVKRDGVSYELIAKALPVIEGEVNNILQQIVEFGIVFDMSGKNVNARIVYEDQHWPLEMCSGMEKFISGLAIRVALINVCNLPRPNFLVVDEGFGTLDSDNLQSIFMMFDYLKTQFDFINIISHLDAMRDVVDTLVEIKKVDGFSQIQYK